MRIGEAFAVVPPATDFEAATVLIAITWFGRWQTCVTPPLRGLRPPTSTITDTSHSWFGCRWP